MTSITFDSWGTGDDDAPKLEATQRDPHQHHQPEHFKGPEIGRRRINAGLHDHPQPNGADEEQGCTGEPAPPARPTRQRPARGNNKTKSKNSDEQHEGYDHIYELQTCRIRPNNVIDNFNSKMSIFAS